MYEIRIKIMKGKEAGKEIQDKIHDLIIKEDLEIDVISIRGFKTDHVRTIHPRLDKQYKLDSEEE